MIRVSIQNEMYKIKLISNVNRCIGNMLKENLLNLTTELFPPTINGKSIKRKSRNKEICLMFVFFKQIPIYLHK